MIGFIKQDFVKKRGGGLTKTFLFPHKEGGWSAKGGLNDFMF